MVYLYWFSILTFCGGEDAHLDGGAGYGIGNRTTGVLSCWSSYKSAKQINSINGLTYSGQYLLFDIFHTLDA